MYIFLCLAASPVLLKPVTKTKQPAVVPKKNGRKLSQSVSIVDVDSDVEEGEEKNDETHHGLQFLVECHVLQSFQNAPARLVLVFILLCYVMYFVLMCDGI